MRRKLITKILAALLFVLPCTDFIKADAAEAIQNHYDYNVYTEDENSLDKAKSEIKNKAEVLVDNTNESPYYNAASVQYAIMQGDKMIVSDNAGVYSRTENRILDKNNMYGIGSVSKMFVTAAVMKLVDEGKVDLDLPVTNYIKDFKMADERYKKITPRMLLNHSSGLMGTTGRNSLLLNDNEQYAHDNLLNSLAGQMLKAEPGAFSVYCNDGFSLAELLVEDVSKMTFSQYMNENFAKALDLEELKTPVDDFDRSLLAKTYTYTGDQFKDDPVENVMSIGAGGIYASAENTAAFARAITRKDGRGLLSSKSVDAMSQAEYLKGIWVTDGEDNSIGYGLGWDSVNLFPFNRYGIKAYCKGGDSGSYHSCVIVLPDLDITMAVNTSGAISSVDEAFAQEALLKLLKAEGIIDDIKDDVQWTSEKSQVMPEYLKQYKGLYNMGNRIAQVDISDDGTLTLNDPEYPNPLIFHHTYSNYFIMDDDAFGIRFVDESNGNTYLEEKSYGKFPELSQTAAAVYAGQKVYEDSLSEDEKAVWQQRNKKPFFILNEKYSSYAYSAGSSPFANFYADNQGYVFGSHIVSGTEAEPFVQIPGAAGRDLSSYKFYTEGGIEYADAGVSKFISIDGVPFLDDNTDCIKLSSEGYTKWFLIPESMAGKTITVECSDHASFNLYAADGSYVNDSYISGIKTEKLGAYNIAAFAGSPGEQFKIVIS